MQLTSLLRSAVIMAVLSVLSLLLFQTAQAQTEAVLYNFCPGGGSCSSGSAPIGPLAADAYGNFYATSLSGGTSGSGTVLGLFPEPSGGCETGTNTGNGWCEFVLYNFCSIANCADGNEPLGSVSYLNAHFRTPGNLYGTTFFGGSTNSGVVFEISSKPVLSSCPAGSNTSGGWCETVIYNFCTVIFANICRDGSNPFGNLVEDSAGNLYGTNANEVFELSPDQQGGWDWQLAYADNFVQGGLAIDGADNLYGVDAEFYPWPGKRFQGCPFRARLSSDKHLHLHRLGRFPEWPGCGRQRWQRLWNDCNRRQQEPRNSLEADPGDWERRHNVQEENPSYLYCREKRRIPCR